MSNFFLNDWTSILTKSTDEFKEELVLVKSIDQIALDCINLHKTKELQEKHQRSVKLVTIASTRALSFIRSSTSCLLVSDIDSSRTLLRSSLETIFTALFLYYFPGEVYRWVELTEAGTPEKFIQELKTKYEKRYPSLRGKRWLKVPIEILKCAVLTGAIKIEGRNIEADLGKYLDENSESIYKFIDVLSMSVHYHNHSAMFMTKIESDTLNIQPAPVLEKFYDPLLFKREFCNILFTLEQLINLLLEVIDKEQDYRVTLSDSEVKILRVDSRDYQRRYGANKFTLVTAAIRK